MSDVSKTNELIAEAHRMEGLCLGWGNPLSARTIRRLADALEAATRVPVQGEPNDDLGALAKLVQRFEECDNPDYLLADFLLSQGVGFSRATAPDAATETATAQMSRLNNAKRKAEVERDATLAAVERVRAAVNGPHPANSGLDSFTLAHISAALDGAPEPEGKR